jgi:RNA polymerase sigma-70 factor (ECF subfamily)
MERLRRGHDEALRVLYQRHAGPLYNFANRLLMHSGIAEEVLQETFLRVYKDRAAFRPVATFKTWAFTIARNLCVDILRSGPRGSEVSINPLPEVADPAPTPLDQLDRAEREAAVRRALAGLAPEDREVLVLSRYHGLKYREIAAIVGASEDAVKMRAHRAITRIRKLLGL